MTYCQIQSDADFVHSLIDTASLIHLCIIDGYIHSIKAEFSSCNRNQKYLLSGFFQQKFANPVFGPKSSDCLIN